MSKKTTKPTGLALSRNDYTFSFTWTPRGDGSTAQQVKSIVTNRNPAPNEQNQSGIKKNTKSTSIALSSLQAERNTNGNTAKYKPLGSKYLTKVTFKVRGKHAGKWSSWQEKSYTIAKPSIPAYVAPSASNQNFTYVYNWDYNQYENSGSVIFVDYEWQTVLYESSVASGKNLPQNIWNLCSSQRISFIDPITGNTLTNQPSTGHGIYSSISIIDDTSVVELGKRRFFRVRARGPAGESDWQYSDHSFAKPTVPRIESGRIDISSATAGTSVTLRVNTQSSALASTDENTFKYAIVNPRTTVAVGSDDWARSTVSLPDGFDQWTDGTTFGSTGTTSTFSFHTDSVVGSDEAMFVKIDASNSGGTSSSIPVLVKRNESEPLALSPPTLGSVSVNPATNSVTVTVTNNATLENNKSFIAVYFRSSEDQEEGQPIGIISYSSTQPQTATFVMPEYGESVTPSIGVACYVADYSPASKVATYPGTLTYYEIDNVMMSSGKKWQTNIVPLPPSDIVLSRAKEGTIRVSFSWTWSAANIAEISWSDDPDAWESTNEPSSYSIDRANYDGKWNITGLGAGTWYVKVRLIKSTDDSVLYGTYSDRYSFDLSSAPDTPNLYLTPKVLAQDALVTATWLYSSTDGTAQASAQLAEAFKVYQKTQDSSIIAGKVYYTLNNGVYTAVSSPVAADLSNYYEDTGDWTYTELDKAMTSGGTSIQFSPATYGWAEGSTHYVSIRVQSASGHQSKDWSNPVKIDVATLPTITVTGIAQSNTDALKEVTIPIGEDDERTDLSLVKLPLEFTVTGAGVGGYTTAAITRAEGFELDRPDDSTLQGFEGETIIERTIQNGSNLSVLFSFNLEDFKASLGHLDDEASYRLTITVTDTYGQVVSTNLAEITNRDNDLFYVHWDHQGVMPTATVVYDTVNKIGKITVPQPLSGYISGDYCEIYRLSADRPQKIVENGVFGTTYVDPYPTYGIFSGYRVVYLTKYGDYRDDEGNLTWTDYGPMEADAENQIGYLDEFAIRLDFDDQSIVLPGNVSLSNSWNKDFQLTRYLGGSMEGDWNPGIERTGSYKATVPIEHDPALMYSMRLLGDYPGVVHVRAPDGSNFYANVNLTDDREAKWVTRLSQVTLNITKVDAVELDGMTLEEWEEVDTSS